MKNILIIGSQESSISFFDYDSIESKSLDNWAKPHTDRIWDLEGIPNDEEHFLSVSQDTTVKMWSIQDKKCKKSFEGHSGLVSECSTNPVSPIFATCSDDSTAIVWNYESGEKITTFQHEDRVKACIFLPDDPNILCTGSWDSTIRLWDVEKQSESSSLKDHSVLVSSMCYDEKKKMIYGVGEDKELIAWDIREPSPTKLLKGIETVNISSLCVFSDENLLVYGTLDGDLVYFNVADWKEKSRVKGAHSNTIWKVKKFLPPQPCEAQKEEEEKEKEIKEEEEEEEGEEGENKEESEVTEKTEEEEKEEKEIEENKDVTEEIDEEEKTLSPIKPSLPRVEGIMTCSYDSTLKFWNLEGECMRTIETGEKNLSFLVLPTSKFNPTKQQEIIDTETEHQKDLEAIEEMKESFEPKKLDNSELETKLEEKGRELEIHKKKYLDSNVEKNELERELRKKTNEFSKRIHSLEKANQAMKEKEIKNFNKVQELQKEVNNFREQKKKKIASFISIREINGLHEQIKRGDLREHNLAEQIERLKQKIMVLEKRNVIVAQRSSNFLEKSFINIHHMNKQCVSVLRREGKTRWNHEKSNRKLHVEKTRNRLLGTKIEKIAKKYEKQIEDLDIENKNFQNSLVDEKKMNVKLHQKLLKVNRNIYNIRMTYEKEIEKLERRKNIEMKIILSCITEKQKKAISDALQLELNRKFFSGGFNLSGGKRSIKSSPAQSTKRARPMTVDPSQRSRKRISEPPIEESEPEEQPQKEEENNESFEETIEPVENEGEKQKEKEVVGENGIKEEKVENEEKEENEKTEETEEKVENEVKEKTEEKEEKEEKEVEGEENENEKTEEVEEKIEVSAPVLRKKKIKKGKKSTTRRKKTNRNNRRKKNKKPPVYGSMKKKTKSSRKTSKKKISPSIVRRRKRRQEGGKSAFIDEKDPVFFISRNKVEGRVFVQKEHQNHQKKNLKLMDSKKKEILLLRKSMIRKAKEKKIRKKHFISLSKYFPKVDCSNKEVQFPDIHKKPQHFADNDESVVGANQSFEHEDQVEENFEEEEEEEEEREDEETCVSDIDERMDDLILDEGDEEFLNDN